MYHKYFEEKKQAKPQYDYVCFWHIFKTLVLCFERITDFECIAKGCRN